MSMLNPKLLSEAFPVNKVEVFFDALDHSNFLGFKWQQVGQGRVPVGLNTSDSDFNSIGKTGGEKTHTLTLNNLPKSTGYVNNLTLSAGAGGSALGKMSDWKISALGDGGESYEQPISNLSPYIVMSFWKRIA